MQNTADIPMEEQIARLAAQVESLSCDNERWIGNPFLDKFQRARPAFPNSTGLM